MVADVTTSYAITVAILTVALAIGLLYVRVLEPLYLHRPAVGPLYKEPMALRVALSGLTLGTLWTGILPQFWVAWAGRAAMLLAATTR